MKKIPTEEAIGTILCHDITQIIPGKVKGRAFEKGHVITKEDIPVLLSLGKDNLYVWEKKQGYLHENEGAERLKNLAAGEGLTFSEVNEGKINFIADKNGVLKIDKDLLLKINSIDEIILATMHNNTPVKKGEKVAGTRVIPLIINEEKIIQAEHLAAEKTIVSIKPYKNFKVAIVTTGNEVYYKRIEDAFGPVVREKLSAFDCEIIGSTIVSDNIEKITAAIEDFIGKGAQMVICTGGMSVDPDDSTPAAIKNTGADIVSYGAPVLPGAMFLVSYKGDVPILGLPGCVMYSKTTIFDLVLPRILTGEKIKKEDIIAYGHGGLCLECEICRYPHCSFGKGC